MTVLAFNNKITVPTYSKEITVLYSYNKTTVLAFNKKVTVQNFTRDNTEQVFNRKMLFETYFHHKPLKAFTECSGILLIISTFINHNWLCKLY